VHPKRPTGFCYFVGSRDRFRELIAEDEGGAHALPSPVRRCSAFTAAANAFARRDADSSLPVVTLSLTPYT
jgi:hypothetical protein